MTLEDLPGFPGAGSLSLPAEAAGGFTVHEFSRPAAERIDKALASRTEPYPVDDWLRKEREELRALLDAPDRTVTADDLVWAATARCRCGAGYCYPKFLKDPHGMWFCAAILIGVAAVGSEHDAAKPFTFWSIKSDQQPSANGATTRPPCGGCGAALVPANYRVADGCPCNSPRGVNHGLVPGNTCTCVACDPEQTGSTRYPAP